eukprot:XP_003726325.1 PREDICTED: omega-amidase NIT2 isoform X2 [Strongylocentrotus purpuratus]
MSSSKSVLKLALVQMAVSANKSENLSRAVRMIGEAAQAGAKIVTLPECFNCPYGTQFFREYAENIPGNSSQTLAAAAKEHKIFVVGGMYQINISLFHWFSIHSICLMSCKDQQNIGPKL